MNPLNSSVTGPNAGTQPTKAVNNESVYIPRTHNTFDMSYFHFLTQRYGFYYPFHVEEGIPSDMLPLSNSHDVASLPMTSQFKSTVSINKDYFFVPNEAIQPKTWQFIYTEPGQGDDVPEDSENIFPTLFHIIDGLFNHVVDTSFSGPSRLWALLCLENFCSSGSVLFNLGFKINPIIIAGEETYSFDRFFDLCASSITGEVEVSTDDFRAVYRIGGSDDIDSSNDRNIYGVNTNEFFSILRRYGSDATISEIDFPMDFDTVTITNVPDYSFRMDRLSAYQLICAHFYVNPKVDFIYNAQLYQDNFLTLLRSYCEDYDYGFEVGSFFRNGVGYWYDSLSRYYYNILDGAFRNVIAEADNYGQDSYSRMYDLISYLFGFRESLRFGDYFTDSRTQRLAGSAEDQTIRVIGDGVNVIDMAEKIILQRFNNAVVKIGNDQDKYLTDVMGGELTPDYHLPKFIVHTENVIIGDEVSNTTSSNQGFKVTSLNSHDDRFAYQIDISRPGVVMGISYFSVPRVYCQTKDRAFFHENRYDIANPMLQHFGDQAVYSREVSDTLINADSAFAWQSRYEEYKQRYSVASGAFVELLSSWANVSDSMFGPVRNFYQPTHQSPDFIRVYDCEFNKFFNQMQGYSLANGFHFIVRYNNKVVANRPLEINPQTL